ncbi:MAG: TonB-dependent receptor [Gammaproteobacteria bacterium]|jgi:iron complex outermembrane receptor protein|nr:TonB-dependent receptor [Gammaproteobacteria bacterium]
MKRSTHQGRYRFFAVVAAALAVGSPVAYSQTDNSDSEMLDEVVTTGTRKQGQSPTETLSPIDVIGGDILTNQATFDLTDSITKVAPSLNTQRFPIADGTAVIRPVTLRNLSPDHTLVLVNGSRRHRSALVNLQASPLGTINAGAQAVDFGVIPSGAVQRIEILRDGASAQYGSDAIAGVVNVILKDASEGFSVSAQTGEYFEGDGARTTISANGGFSLGDGGFLNATIEHSTADKTSRGTVRFDCPAVIDEVGAENTPFNGLCQRWGDPDVETLKIFVNAGIDLTDAVELFGNLSYSENEFRSDFFYRPGVVPGVGGSGSLIVDDGNGFAADASQSLVDQIEADGLNPSDYLTADAGSPSGFVLLNPISSQFPGGFNPDFGADITDFAALVGLRGEMAGGMSWDARFRTAENEADYLLGNTINPSLGRLSPTNFKPGRLTQEETAFTVDFVKDLDFGNFASPLTFAFGAEWREETYTIAAGDPASVEIGPTFIEFGFGSESFQGYDPVSAGTFESSNIAAYVDFEADITDRFSAGLAIRFEDYDEFGNTSDFKLSGRFEVTETFAIRGTVNTGFRAPTAGQVNTLNGTTSADASGTLVPNFTYPVANPVALALGSQPLVPEESTSFTIGAVFQPFDNTSVTIDYYDITIEDRLTLFAIESLTQDDVDELTDAGIPNAGIFLGSRVAYFANGFESGITGIDLSIVSDFELSSGNLMVDFRANFNDSDVSKVAPMTLNTSEIYDFENQVPDNRMSLTFNYDTGNMLSGLVRLNNYGGWGDSGGQVAAPDASEVVEYGSEILVDVEATFRFGDNFRVAVGGENIFDALPDDDGHFVSEILGVDKALTSPFGFNGGFWYVRLAADF